MRASSATTPVCVQRMTRSVPVVTHWSLQSLASRTPPVVELLRNGSRITVSSRAGGHLRCDVLKALQQCLYFLPLPQGQGSFRPVERDSSASASRSRMLLVPRPDPGQLAHAAFGVGEEAPESGAEPVQSRLPVRRQEDAVLRALPVAGEQVGQSRQCAGRVSRLACPNARCCSEETSSPTGSGDVAQEMRRVDEVVAGVEVAVVLQGDPFAAGGSRMHRVE